MKGETIHDLAKECLFKFLIKKQAEMGENEFKSFVVRNLEANKTYETNPSKLVDNLRDYFKFSHDLLMNLDIVKLLNFKGPHADHQRVITLLVHLVNRFMILIDNYKKMKDGNGLIINKNVSLERLPQRISNQHFKNMMDYFFAV